MNTELTDDDLKAVDEIINETAVVTDWAGGSDLDSSTEVDDAEGTLRKAAQRVRKFLSLRRNGQSIEDAKAAL